MLQKEKEKADKKILETKSKAEEIIGKLIILLEICSILIADTFHKSSKSHISIIERRNHNIKMYEQKLKEDQKLKGKRSNEIKKAREAKQAREEAIEKRKFDVYKSKKEEAQELKRKKQELRKTKQKIMVCLYKNSRLCIPNHLSR